jgi:mannosyltransferase OCH1-like enzyme
MTDTKMHAATSQLGGRLPKQIQRALPVYIACILIIVFISNVDSFGSSLKAVKRELTYQSTLTRGTQFPRKIWQTWKVDPLGFDERDLTCARTWTSKNPGHRYEVLTDSNDLYYVETHFGPAGLNRRDIVDTYRSLTAKIVKADLLRYLVMYVEGGVYADIDVEALKPIDRFIPDRYNERDVDMVIGIEVDQPELNNHPILGKKSESFCQWTFMCKPRLPVMLRLIDNIVKWLNDVAKKQRVPISEIVLDFDEVISGTGPSAFTSAILAEMSARDGQAVNWDSFHNMAESKLVGGVLVLTVEAFAAGQGHSDSGNHNARTALVKHHYHASGWPTNHPRYNHPVYGEVEKCNWDTECIKLWDVNKAAFESLPPEDQAKMIALREVADAQAAQLDPS